MKKVYSILFIFCLEYGFSQMLYTLQTSRSSIFESITETAAGDYLLVNQNKKFAPQFELYKSQLLQLNQQGQVIDSVTFPANFCIAGAPLQFANFYFCYGGQINTYGPNDQSVLSVVFKLDQNLNIVEKKIIDSTYNEGLMNSKIISMNNNFFLVVSRSDMNGFKHRIYKTDVNIQKQDSFFSTGYVADMISFGKDLLISGDGFPQGSIYGNAQIMKCDTAFNVISRFNLDNLATVNPGCSQTVGIAPFAANLIEITSPKFMVTGYYPVANTSTCHTNYQTISSVITNTSQVLKTNIVGRTFKDHTMIPVMSSSKRYDYFYNLSMSGYDTQNPDPPIQTNTTEILVYKSDSSGNLVWVKYFSEPDIFYSPNGILATADSGVLVTGIRYNIVNPAVQGAGEGFVMKIDKNGNQVYVGIMENGGFNTNYHKCFPNPANSKLHFDIPMCPEAEIRIFDGLGHEIRRLNKYQGLTEIDIQDLAAGVYTYAIRSEKNLMRGKFVKE